MKVIKVTLRNGLLLNLLTLVILVTGAITAWRMNREAFDLGTMGVDRPERAGIADRSTGANDSGAPCSAADDSDGGRPQQAFDGRHGTPQAA